MWTSQEFLRFWYSISDILVLGHFFWQFGTSRTKKSRIFKNFSDILVRDPWLPLFWFWWQKISTRFASDTTLRYLLSQMLASVSPKYWWRIITNKNFVDNIRFCSSLIVVNEVTKCYNGHFDPWPYMTLGLHLLIWIYKSI